MSLNSLTYPVRRLVKRVATFIATRKFSIEIWWAYRRPVDYSLDSVKQNFYTTIHNIKAVLLKMGKLPSRAKKVF